MTPEAQEALQQRKGSFEISGPDLPEVMNHLIAVGAHVPSLEVGSSNARWKLSVHWPSHPEAATGELGLHLPNPPAVQHES